MNKLTVWTEILMLFFVVLLTACGGGGDGGPAAPIGDITGAWSITEDVDPTACGDAQYTDTYTAQMVQTGSSVSVTIKGDTYTGSLNGSSLTYSGSHPDNGGITQGTVSLTIASSCNSLSGSANWTWSDGAFTCSGTTQVSGTRDNPVGCGAVPGTPPAGSVAAPVTYNFEGGTVPAAFSMSGDVGWVIDNNNGSGGSVKSLRSGTITDNQTSCVAITVSGSSSVNYDYSVSSEQNWDFLVFYIDGVEEDDASGNVPWTSGSFVVTTGIHEYKWCYKKDNIDTEPVGSDAAWIDNITIN